MHVALRHSLQDNSQGFELALNWRYVMFESSLHNTSTVSWVLYFLMNVTLCGEFFDQYFLPTSKYQIVTVDFILNFWNLQSVLFFQCVASFVDTRWRGFTTTWFHPPNWRLCFDSSQRLLDINISIYQFITFKKLLKTFYNSIEFVEISITVVGHSCEFKLKY